MPSRSTREMTAETARRDPARPIGAHIGLARGDDHQQDQRHHDHRRQHEAVEVADEGQRERRRTLPAVVLEQRAERQDAEGETDHGLAHDLGLAAQPQA